MNGSYDTVTSFERNCIAIIQIDYEKLPVDLVQRLLFMQDYDAVAIYRGYRIGPVFAKETIEATPEELEALWRSSRSLL